MDSGHPVTKPELDAALVELRTELQAELRTEMKAQKDEIMDGMRQIETNILTAFHGYARGISAHMHTLDVGDQDLRLRVGVLEDRVLSLELRRPPA